MAKLLSSPAARSKIKRTMTEFSKGKLRSGSKKGPKVTNRKQAIAISLSQAKRAADGE
jgi:hypothetical protein